MKGDILHGYWNTSEVQSLAYIIDNSSATKCYKMAKMETFGCRMRGFPPSKNTLKRRRKDDNARRLNNVKIWLKGEKTSFSGRRKDVYKKMSKLRLNVVVKLKLKRCLFRPNSNREFMIIFIFHIHNYGQNKTIHKRVPKHLLTH